MNAPTKLPFVHESEVQRQYARIRIPGYLAVIQCDQTVRCKLWDISAGGCSFKPLTDDVDLEGLQTGELQLKINDIGISIPIHFQTIGVDTNTGYSRCAFQDLGPREASVLHHIIGSFLSGELVSVGDILHTLGRENFTKPRPSHNSELEGSARTRALVRTGATLALGFAAFVYASTRIYDLYFVTHASAARVAATMSAISMPRDGIFSSLVPADGIVKKGAPLGSFQSLISDLMDINAPAQRENLGQLARIIGQPIKGTVTSPCDCRVLTQHVADKQYVGKGQILFDLVAQDLEPHILARFLHDDIDRITPGTGVRFRISGEANERDGHIERVRSPGRGDELGGEIIAEIKPDEPVSPQLIGRPVSLSTRSFSHTRIDAETEITFAKAEASAPP
ncbi:MAG: HlyD family efflux transporter periplasmic adaptor subunit [Porticoccaceae bacterium]